MSDEYLGVPTICRRGHRTLSTYGVRVCHCGEWAEASSADRCRVSHALALGEIRRLRTLGDVLSPECIRANIRMSLQSAAEARRDLALILANQRIWEAMSTPEFWTNPDSTI